MNITINTIFKVVSLICSTVSYINTSATEIDITTRATKLLEYLKGT